jgi:UPF0755 protein
MKRGAWPVSLFFRAFLIVLVFLAVAGLLTAWLIFMPYQGFQQTVMVDFPRGTTTQGMAEELERKGVIRGAWQFLLIRALQRQATLQAGEYQFTHAASAWEVFNRVRSGDVFLYRLAVPEGYNIFEIADAIEQGGIISREDFLRSARDPSLIQDLAPAATSLEGYLFPDTYLYPRGMSASELTRRMNQRFRRAWAQTGSTEDVHRVVTLASLIEKETGVPDERRLVSSVIQNRIRLGMPLQIDPTVIYAARLEERYRGEGKIYQSDLQSPHPYNTYRNSGMPPGPIANPGLPSLRAALDPAETDYLFFVARPDGSGAHVFSRDLATHNRAVMEYRRGQSEN